MRQVSHIPFICRFTCMLNHHRDPLFKRDFCPQGVQIRPWQLFRAAPDDWFFVGCSDLLQNPDPSPPRTTQEIFDTWVTTVVPGSQWSAFEQLHTIYAFLIHFAKSNDDFARFVIDPSHLSNLMHFLNKILLVDTECVDPDPYASFLVTQVAQG